MIHTVEGDDIQPTDDTDYTRPFGVPDEEKPDRLGFRDPRIIVPPPWDAVRPSGLKWLERWIRKTIFRLKR